MAIGLVLLVLSVYTLVYPEPRNWYNHHLFLANSILEGKITVFGGDQIRPNIHIEDMTDLYLWALTRPGLYGILNAGFENLTIKDIASNLSG